KLRRSPTPRVYGRPDLSGSWSVPSCPPWSIDASTRAGIRPRRLPRSPPTARRHLDELGRTLGWSDGSGSLRGLAVEISPLLPAAGWLPGETQAGSRLLDERR